VSAHLANTYRTLRNIERDPHVSISVEFGSERPRSLGRARRPNPTRTF
jgi:hypothetical protein